MGKRLKIGLGVGFVALLIGVGTLWFVDRHELEEIEVEQPPEVEAQINPHLGLEHFLEALDVDVEARPDPGEPRRVVDADVFLFSAELATYEDWWQTAIDKGLGRGGHFIIIQPRQFDDGPGASLYDELWLDPYDEESPDVAEEVVEEYDYHYDTVEISAITEFGEFAGEMDDDAESEADDDSDDGQVYGPLNPDWVAVNQQGEVLGISASRSHGRVTVLTRGDMLENSGISEGEAGRFLADVLSLDDRWPDDALLFLETRDRGWIAGVAQRGWPLFVGLIVALVFGLTRARRFGPPIPEPERRRQRRGDHIRGTGHFLWKHNASEVLVESTRRALIDKLIERRPSLQTLGEERRLEVMAEELEMSLSRLQHLVDGPVPMKDADVQSLIVELERIRRRL